VFEPVSPELFFKGRPGDLRLGEWISGLGADEATAFSLFGCPDDTGVQLNRGRSGAAQGPMEIRRAFYKMAFPMDGSWNEFSLKDFGNIPIAQTIQQTHDRAFQASKSCAQKTQGVIVLGGGHDFAAPCFLGFAAGRKALHSRATFGLINIDPHLDVRELEAQNPHSGTPFRQVLESKAIKGTNFVQFGCRENRNSKSHWEFCQKNQVQLVSLEAIRLKPAGPLGLFKRYLSSLEKRVSEIGVTLDMDSCHEILGTSAAPAVGFSISELFQIAYWAGTQKSVKYFELAELAPPLDPSGKSALAAAEILYAFLLGKARSSRPLKSSRLKRKNGKNTKKL